MKILDGWKTFHCPILPFNLFSLILSHSLSLPVSLFHVPLAPPLLSLSLSLSPSSFLFLFLPSPLPFTVDIDNMNFIPLIAPPFYTGTELTIHCDVFVPNSVHEDTNLNLMIDVSLQKDGVSVASGGRFTFGEIEYFGPSGDNTRLYRSMITISPLVRMTDIGQWICRVNFSSSDTLVDPSSFQSDVYSLNKMDVPGKRR